MSALMRYASFTLTLTLAGSAFARRPPALERAQAASDRVLATCEDQIETGAGYRDMHTRLGWDDDRSDRHWAPPVDVAAQGRTIGQIVKRNPVLVCEGGFVHEGSGYRDMRARFPNEEPRIIAIVAPWGSSRSAEF